MRVLSIAILALTTILAAPVASFAETCPDALNALRTALTSASLEEVVSVYRSRVRQTCFGNSEGTAASWVALRYGLEADRMAAAGAAPANRLKILREGLLISQQGAWQLHEAMGDILQATEDFSAASTSYQLGMNAARYLVEGMPEPSPERLRALIGKAEQARLLASSVVNSPPLRDGSPGGLGLLSLRGVEIKRVAQPIWFVTDSDDPTPEGTLAIQQLQKVLEAQGNRPIRLVGHTDERGSHEYNDALSLRRAQRVASILEKANYPPNTIRVEGRGKRQPFSIVEVKGVTYSQAQRWQLDRRVELVR